MEEPTTTTAAEPLAHRVITEHAPVLRKEFDQALENEIKSLYGAVDAAIHEEKKADDVLPRLLEADKLQQAHCLALIRKNINDIFGALEMLRAGYFDLSQSILRGIIEGFCTAILINTDAEIFQQYRDNRYSVNTSVDRVARRQDLGLSPDGTKQIKDIYQQLHSLTHPTILSVASQFPFQENGGYPIGGTFDAAKVVHYRAHVERLKGMAMNIAGFLQERFAGESVAGSR